MTTPQYSAGMQNVSEKPGMVTAIAVMTLVSGIINVIWGLTVGFGLTVSIVLICVAPIAILPILLGVFEIVYAARLLTNPPQPVQPSQTIAILEICCFLIGNVFATVVGILALVFYNDPVVKMYFARINGQPAPAPPIPVTPPQPVLPTEPVQPALPAEPLRPAAEATLVAPVEPVQPEAKSVKPKKTPVEKAAAKPTEPLAQPEAEIAKQKKPRAKKSGSSSS